MTLLRVVNLAVTLEGAAILHGVSLDLRRGDTLLLLGRSGAGKSVFIKALLGFLPHQSGHVELEEHIPTLGHLRRHVMLVHQAPALLDDMTALQNVALPLQWSLRQSWPVAHHAALRALERVGAHPLAHHTTAQLSAGERKLVSMARALALDPKALLLDEPTTGLDAGSAARIGATVAAIAKDGTAVVVVSHDVETFRTRATRVALMHQGALLMDAPAAHAFEHPPPALAQFVAGAQEGPLTWAAAHE